MKKMMTAAAILACGIAAPAWADGANTGTDTTTITVSGSTPPKCDLTGGQNVTLSEYDLTDNQGRARTNIGNTIAAALNAQNMHAWCTGASNNVKATRTSLNLTTGSGVPIDNFNTAAIYDVVMTIDGAARLDGYPGPGTEATEDLSGPNTGHFGPSGQGAAVTWDNFSGNSSAVTDGSTTAKARSSYTPSSNRMIAGSYTGTLTIEITPGN